ncbi:AAA family ATPase [Crocosphaera sp. UHCC 0190]|uniref:ATP-dependent DNA helicase n=1 Tax=Crocosphaera sp. UHCC 0190 TaxID=3110246 RepID=UPI002B20A168|nr:AAA family ATPase [Crocosphaera sp. UHCC 0190]MEA5511762.1 AAA family ATPase [Crocosphaera sp. UHCC 0190]
MKSLVVPDELGEMIEAVIEFYQDAVTSIEPSIVYQELRQNLLNWVTRTVEKIERNKLQQTELTLDQYRAYQDIINFIESNKERYFRLSGYAGTGKTHLMVKVIQWLKETEFKYIVAAPTNKAAKNLTQIARNQGLQIEATTVAKLLRLQPVIDLNTGEQQFEFIEGKELELKDYDVIIIDEYSMLNKENFRDLQQAIQGEKTQLIFVGDSAQLPPVKEKEPIVAHHPDINRNAHLTSVVRYDGEIAKVAETIRSDSRWNRQTYPFETSDDGTIIKLNVDDWFKFALSHFEQEDWLINPDYVRIIAWRNKTVDKYNEAIREALYGQDVEQLVIGDRLIAKKPVFRKLPGGKQRQKTIILNNSEECKIIETPQLNHNNKYKWEFYQVKVRTDEGGTIELRILTEESEVKRQEELKKLAKIAIEDENYSEKKKRWAIYFELDELFDNMAYAYALTCHKAQGSSIDNVFLLVSDMHHCQDKQKMLYTGLTRAKKSCYVA